MFLRSVSKKLLGKNSSKKNKETVAKQVEKSRKGEIESDGRTSQPNEPSTSSQPQSEPFNSQEQMTAENIFLGDVHVHETHHHHDGGQQYDESVMEMVALELERQLWEAAKKASSRFSAPVNLERSLIPVPIQLSANPKILQQEVADHGHFTRRGDMQQIYQGQCCMEISPKDLFKKAKLSASEAQYTRSNLTGDSEYAEKQGRIVAVVGQAGIGKTTFLKTFVQKALLADSGLEISFIFFISIRNLDFTSKPKNLLRFLLHSILPDWKHSKESDNYLLKRISSSRNTLLSLDGLDESDVEKFDKKSGSANMYEKASTWKFLINLISGNLLPFAYKIITSRPNQLYSLHASHRPNFLTEILGLDENGQEGLGQQICGARYPEIKEIVRENGDLQAIMYVPVNCILTFSFLMHETEDLDSISFTRVLAFTCSRYATSDHLRGECSLELDMLAKFAWNSFKKRKYAFGRRDLQQAGIGESVIHSFLHTSVTSSANLRVTILEGHKQLYFPHLVMHEFFAAIYFVYLMPEEEFATSLKLLTLDQYEVVGRFAYGLLNHAIVKQLEPLIQVCSFSQKKDLMQKFLVDCIRSFESFIDQKYMSWIPEANNNDITNAIVKVFLDNLESWEYICLSGAFYPADCCNLAFILPLIPGYSINVVECDFRGASLEKFAQQIRSKNIRLKAFQLNGKMLLNADLKSIASFISNVDKMDLNNCARTSIEHLTKKIEGLQNHQLEALNLRGNPIGNKGVKALARCIQFINELDLRNCSITDVEPLAQSISSLQKPLRLLNLRENKIENAGVNSLAKCIHNISSLKLEFCYITNIDPIAESIAALPSSSMKELTLGDNKIGDKGAASLARCIHRIGELHVWNCDIRDIAPLAQSIASLQQPIKALSLYGNMIDNIVALTTCFQHIERLYVQNCHIKDIRPLTDAIMNLQKPMLELNLSGNNFSFEQVKELSQCLHKVRKLFLHRNDVTEDGANLLQAKVKDLKDSQVVFDS